MTLTPAFFIDKDPAALPMVLLVDDDETILGITSAVLRARGFAVTEAGSGEEALRLIQDDMLWPDIVLLDAMMPGLDGFATCERLRRLPGHDATPVLMLTGLDDDASIARAYEAGATDFYVKTGPHQWNLLTGRLRYLLRSARTRQELVSSRAKLARAQSLARMGSFEWRPVPRTNKGRLEFSPEAKRVFGLLPEEPATLATLLHMVVRRSRRSLLQLLTESVAKLYPITTDIEVTLRDGRRRIVHIDVEPELSDLLVFDGNYTGIVQDVTDRRVAEDKIRHLANYDSLTGLPNRRHLMWRTERALEHARRQGHACALLLIDLDRFKVINDTLGHAAGDEMLCEVASRLRACLRHSEQVIEGALESAGSRAHRSLEAAARLGGDEFVALLPDVADESDAQRVAQRVLDALRAPVFVGGQECFITASVGIALFPRDGQTVLDLLRNSDVAMYAVKAAGRNAAKLYSPTQSATGREKLALESALHKALERGELVLHYQPKIDVRSLRMVGAEALMRWRRGDTLVAPADFIPLAEESGLIVPMSEWALHEAARQAKAWGDAFGFADSIAVNMPTRLIERADLVDRIHEATSLHGVAPRSIQLEITETGLMKDMQEVIPALQRLNAVGVEVSIDDFGTGYSSLAYLTSLPISELKIDRRFVKDLGVTPQSSAVVTAIIALARSLGLRVVAEGVADERQMDVLNRLGCSMMQGFLFSRPVPADDLERWLTQTLMRRHAPWSGRAVPAQAESEALMAVPARAVLN